MITLDWGRIPYENAVSKQLEELDFVASGEEDRLIFCTHPPVVTLGRGTQAGDVFAWTGEVVESSRGGRATFHGLNQIVIYPILNLNNERKFMPKKDIRALLKSLGAAVVDALAHFDIKSEFRNDQDSKPGSPSLTGVWVGDRKIASIGIAVKKWISYHGIAINVEADNKAFQGINPCGFQSSVMISVEECLGKPLPRDRLTQVLDQSLRKQLL